MAGDKKGHHLFGEGHHSKREKLLENLSGLAELCRLHHSQGDSTANSLEGSISVGAVPSPTRTTANRAPLPSHNEKCMRCCVVFMQRSPSCFLEDLIYRRIYPKHCGGLVQRDSVCGIVYLILVIYAKPSKC